MKQDRRTRRPVTKGQHAQMFLGTPNTPGTFNPLGVNHFPLAGAWFRVSQPMCNRALPPKLPVRGSVPHTFL